MGLLFNNTKRGNCYSVKIKSYAGSVSVFFYLHFSKERKLVYTGYMDMTAVSMNACFVFQMLE